MEEIREREILYDFTHMWNQKSINETKTNIDKENRLVVTRREGGWGGD